MLDETLRLIIFSTSNQQLVGRVLTVMGQAALADRSVFVWAASWALNHAGIGSKHFMHLKI
jgi:hypothetical protein